MTNKKKGANLSPWNVKADRFPKNGKIGSKLKFLIRYAILAPSGHNSQPWKFAIEGRQIHILPDYLRVRKTVDPENRELYIALGAAAKNLELAANNFGMMFETRLAEGKIVFDFKEGKTTRSNKELFEAIVKRNTNRNEYLKKEVEKEKLGKLKEIEGESSWVEIFDQRGQKQNLAKLVYEAALVWYKSRDLMEELREWLREDVEVAGDGLPTGVLNLYKVATEVKYMFSGDGEEAKARAERDKELVLNSPVLAVVVSKNDTVEEWIDAGKVYEQLALELTKMGLSNGFFNTVVELKGRREKLAKTLGVKGKVQMLLRIGYSTSRGKLSTRRPLEEVLG